MKERQRRAAAGHEIEEIDRPEGYRLVLSRKLLTEHPVEFVRRMHGHEDDLQAGTPDELEELRRIHRNRFGHGGRLVADDSHRFCQAGIECRSTDSLHPRQKH